MNSVELLYRKLTNWRWELGFLDNSLDGVVAGEPLKVHWVNLPFRDRWFADPFILDYNDSEIVLLCEEYSDELKRGRIAKVVVDRKSYELKSWKIILDCPTHLSFPRVVRTNGQVYIHPENSASGCHTLYRYEQEKDELVEPRVICKEPLTDAVMLEDNEKSLLFSTYVPNPNGNVLSVYRGNEGGSVRSGEAIFDNNCARMAGDFFRVGGKLYRPAQDCNGGYGKAVIIQQAECDDKGLWTFRDVRRLESTHPVLDWGLHTFNHYKDLIVIDVKGPRYPRTTKAIRFVKTLIQKLRRK